MADLAPQNFGRYLLRQRVGRGGMAEVFRASLPGFGGFDKVVAIKRMFREFGHDPGFVQMLTDEAKIVSQLAHPNIVQILDVGRQGDDYFMAFEFVEGVDLFAVLQRHHETESDLPLEIACFVVAELCAALDHAHSRRNLAGESLGIVHRDVSPQNVLLSYLGEVKLTDFGIAKAADRFTQTQAGLVKGKVYYMAPEQVLGHAIDHRADLFAAGILLYETLVTQPLYDELDQKKLLDVVSRVDYRWPTDKVQRVPAALRAVVERALRPRAEERFQSGSEMRSAITAALRELGLRAERDDVGNYLRAMYGLQPDRPPTVVALTQTHHQDRDERWNSRVDVRPPQLPDPADGPTYRDPALPPRLPGARPQPPTRSEPIARPAAPAAVPGRNHADPVATAVPRPPPAPVASTPPPVPPAAVPSDLAALQAPTVPKPKPSQPAMPQSDARPAPRLPPKPAAQRPSGPVGALGSGAGEPPPLPGDVTLPVMAAFDPSDEPTGPPLARPAQADRPPPTPALRLGPAGPLPPRPIAPRPVAGTPTKPPSSPQVPAAQPQLAETQLTPAPTAPRPPAQAKPPTPRPAPAASAAPPPPSPPVPTPHEESTRELDADEMARRLGLAKSFDAMASAEPTRAMQAMDDADLDDTTKPQRPGRARAAAPQLVGPPPLPPGVDPDDLPANGWLLTATAAVWVVAVVLAVYATLITVRHGG